MADRIRDRTLVLRVTFSSLQNRLRAKMSAAQENAVIEAKGASSAISTSMVSGGGGNISASDTLSRGTATKDGQLEDLDGVTVKPSAEGSTLFYFHCDNDAYPGEKGIMFDLLSIHVFYHLPVIKTAKPLHYRLTESILVRTAFS